MPNVTKGRGITGCIAYCRGEGNAFDKYLQPKERDPNAGTRVEIIGGQNFGFTIDSPETVELARRIMEWSAFPENQTSKTRKTDVDCLHLSLSWDKGYRPDRDEMERAAKSALEALGMERARAVFIAHHDTDHAHVHIVASRIDPATGRAFSDLNDITKAHAWALRWERENGQISESRAALHKAVNAAKRGHIGPVLDYLTDREATFSARDLKTLLGYAELPDAQREKFRLEVLADREVIGLRDGPVTRYTTREVLAAEMMISRAAAYLDQRAGHGVDAKRIQAIADRLTLIPEQRAALDHLTRANGFAVLAGEAGTGKSHTLRAVREAYEAEGFTVIGTAWTHKVVGDMRNDGFRNPTTLAAELKRLETGSSKWNADTVIIIDEAAMLSTKALAQTMERAAAVGAKVILAGDDQQLGSIEGGGMFTVLRNALGAAELHVVQRTKDPAQKRAFNQMHARRFAEALGTFDQQGAIHWKATQREAAIGLAEQYSADVSADPTKDRFIFAYTNDDVAALNDFARKLARQGGRLGEDHSLTAADGAAAFAVGDRMQFVATAKAPGQRAAGLVNGNVGTVMAIEQKDGRYHVTVMLDTAKGKTPQLVRFVAGGNAEACEFDGFRHGYAGTIYKGQGRTLDQAYVYHTKHWKSASSYVALSRHRLSVAIFVARTTAKDVADLARQMGRDDSKRAASYFTVDPGYAARADFQAAAGQATGQATGQTARDQTAGQSAGPRVWVRSSRVPPMPSKQQPAGKSRRANAGRASGSSPVTGAGRVAGGLASGFAKTLESLSTILGDLLGGGPTEEQRQRAKEADRAQPAPEQREDPLASVTKVSAEEQTRRRGNYHQQTGGLPESDEEAQRNPTRRRDEGQSQR